MYVFLTADDHFLQKYFNFLLPCKEGFNFDLVRAVQCKTLDTISASVTHQMVPYQIIWSHSCRPWNTY